MPLTRRDLMSGPGWTPLPNWILNRIQDFDPNQFKILLFIARRIWGYETPNHNFSVRKIAQHTGRSKSTVHTHLRRLLDEGYLEEMGLGPRGSRLLTIPHHCPVSEDSSVPSSPPPERFVEPPVRPAAQPLSAPAGRVHKNKKYKNNVRTVQSESSPPSERSGIFSSLRERLSPSTISMIESAFLGEREGTLLFQDTILTSLRSLLSSYGNVTFISTG